MYGNYGQYEGNMWGKYVWEGVWERKNKRKILGKDMIRLRIRLKLPILASKSKDRGPP